LREAVECADRSGIILLCSGNESHHRWVFPASYEETINIGCCKPDGFPTDGDSWKADFLFLGEQIVVDEVPFLESQKKISGSSIATAIATGLASLIFSCCYGAHLDLPLRWRRDMIHRMFDDMTRADTKYVQPSIVFSENYFGEKSIDVGKKLSELLVL
jgi:hypothetical protein